MIKSFLWFAVLLTLGGCATFVTPPRIKTDAVGPPYAAWARVLHAYVDGQGRVDFAGLAKHPSDLDQFVAWIYQNGPSNRPNLFTMPGAILAFDLNAYNALAMFNVIRLGIPKTNAGLLERARFFYFRDMQVGGRRISLYDYENDVIRNLGDPRVHFALNCMSRSCPRLPRVPFRAARLNAQLNRQAREFFNETRNVEVNDANKTVRLSAILKFYTQDFLHKAPSLIAYVNRYRSDKVPPDYTVKFIPYDWTINRQP